MIAREKISQIQQRFAFLEAQMNAGASADDLADLAREYADLKPVVDQTEAYGAILTGIEEAEALLSDPEMRDLARVELEELKAALPEAEHAVKRLAFMPAAISGPRVRRP